MNDFKISLTIEKGKNITVNEIVDRLISLSQAVPQSTDSATEHSNAYGCATLWVSDSVRK